MFLFHFFAFLLTCYFSITYLALAICRSSRRAIVSFGYAVINFMKTIGSVTSILFAP
jgi:hypothetical protein